MAFITGKNISMSYEGKKVIDSVSFFANEGDCLLILGENGSGKTTLLKALTSLKKIDSGSLLFDSGLKSGEIGYLPQQTDVQRDFPASVWEVVLSGCINQTAFLPFYTKKQKTIAKNAMERLEILPLSKKCYHELSGGQKQRVLLARALCASKKLLILDEPTTGLDVNASREFYSLISRLNKDNMTIIMISHDVQNAILCANKVLHLGYMKSDFYDSVDEYKRAYIKAGDDRI